MDEYCTETSDNTAVARTVLEQAVVRGTTNPAPSIAASCGLPELTQDVIRWFRSSHGHSTPSLKISCKSVQLFSRNLAEKETKKERNKETKKSSENNTPSSYRRRGKNIGEISVTTAGWTRCWLNNVELQNVRVKYCNIARCQLVAIVIPLLTKLRYSFAC